MKAKAIRRRRKCAKCLKRFTTYERIEQTVRLMVVKKDGRRVPWDKDKILRGLERACFKRPVPETEILRVAEEVDPMRLAMLRAVGLINGVGAFVLHNGSGVAGKVDPGHNRPANLWEPADDDRDYGPRGVFGDRSHDQSPQWWMTTHRRPLLASAALVAGALGFTSWRRR